MNAEERERKFRKTAFFRDFPFLIGVSGLPVENLDEVTYVAVRRVNRDLLERQILGNETIYLFNDANSVVAQLGEGETVGVALLDTNPSNIAWIVVSRGSKAHNDTNDIFVYKRSKDFTLKQWVEEQLDGARAEIDAECDREEIADGGS